MNLPLENWHNHFAAIQAVDQAVRLFLGFLGEENDGAVTFQLQICLNAIFKFLRSDPAHVGYSKVNVFVCVVFNINMQHVGEFAMQ